jgi:hypothetical protein
MLKRRHIKRPTYIYHATTEQAVESIIKDKLIRRGWEGLVYTAGTKEDALSFVSLRPTVVGTVEVEIDGEMVSFPKTEFPDKYMIIEIATRFLDWDKMTEGTDHNPRFFKGAKVYAYLDDIPTKAVQNVFEFERGGN